MAYQPTKKDLQQLAEYALDNEIEGLLLMALSFEKRLNGHILNRVAYLGWHKACREMIRQGYNVNRKDDAGWCPLELAIDGWEHDIMFHREPVPAMKTVVDILSAAGAKVSKEFRDEMK